MLEDARAAARFAWRLGPYLRSPIRRSQAEAILADSLREREGHFLRLLQAVVYGHPRNPSGNLLRWAGISMQAASAMVRQTGIQGTLERMHDAGVFVTIDEFKGNRPIARPGLHLKAHARDFANPLAAGHIHGTTSASRSKGTALAVNLDSLALDAAYLPLIRGGLGLEGSVLVMWRPGPPGVAGLGISLMAMKVGIRIAHWFSQTPVRWDAANRKYALFLASAAGASRLAARALPIPRHVPLTEARAVAAAVADLRRKCINVVVDAPASSAVRVCLAAAQHGLDISGSTFRTGGEPLSEAKSAIFEKAGCTAYCNYFIGEFGLVGAACGDRRGLDDVHVAADRIGIVQRQTDMGGTLVGALFATSLHPLARRVVINAETGDYAQVSQRECGCPLGRLGLHTHLSGIRSYEKLTSEGMTFLGSALSDIVERVLPGRFGGGPGDYQFVESEVDGLPRVTIVVSPRVGEVDAKALTAVVLDALGSASAPNRMMATFLRDGDTLRVQRREPHITRTAKVHALHVLKPGEG